MQSWIIPLALLFVAVLAFAVFRLRRAMRRQRDAVRAIRESRLYAHVYPLLMRCEKLHVEQVSLYSDGLYIQLYRPAGRMLTYRFEQHGFHPVPPHRLYPMAQALAVDFKPLADARKYHFCPRTRVHSNGDREEYYEYNITTAYKDQVQRTLYGRQHAQE